MRSKCRILICLNLTFKNLLIIFNARSLLPWKLRRPCLLINTHHQKKLLSLKVLSFWKSIYKENSVIRARKSSMNSGNDCNVNVNVNVGKIRSNSKTKGVSSIRQIQMVGQNSLGRFAKKQNLYRWENRYRDFMRLSLNVKNALITFPSGPASAIIILCVILFFLCYAPPQLLLSSLVVNCINYYNLDTTTWMNPTQTHSIFLRVLAVN